MNQLTVSSIIANMLPNGSRGNALLTREAPSISEFPFWPPDLYAVCASLLEQSDAYTYILSSGPNTIGAAIEDKGPLIYLANEWVEKNFKSKLVSEELQNYWNILISTDTSIVDIDESTEWVKAAIMLLIIADEACSGIGYLAFDEPEVSRSDRKMASWITKAFELINAYSGSNEKILDAFRNVLPDDNIYSILSDFLEKSRRLEAEDNDQFSSACLVVPSTVACVLPKSRTPSSGCTLRSLTHHLSLHPGSGQLRSNWILPPRLAKIIKNDLNILFFPYPYEVDNDCFTFINPPGKTFGLFKLSQSWLRRDKDSGSGIVENVCRIVKEASRHRRIDVVLLPESSIDIATYDALVIELQKISEEDKPIILIAGVMNVSGEKVVENVARCRLLGGEHGVGFQQRKHHRWALDDRQIDRYMLPVPEKPDAATALGGPKYSWWEDISIHKREINYFVFRQDSCLATLICEDLARTEPCQTSIRSVGPNVLIALLMDGPQIAGRWPDRYVLGLTDDPGTSVLSVTSQALIKRSNQSVNGCSRTIALWGDCVNGRRELEMSCDGKAILIELQNQPRVEETLDSRRDAGRADVWIYVGHKSFQ